MVQRKLKGFVHKQGQTWHRKRFALFLSVLRRAAFPVRSIVDLGGGNGAYIAPFIHRLPGIEITVADISPERLMEARTLFGFKTVELPEQGPLPFADHEYDFIFCNSVIEHVTVPKEDVWKLTDDVTFRCLAREHQVFFASEVMRTSRGYFVQTPHRMFPIESHTWLPFVQCLPRPLLIPLLRCSNRLWIKATDPDWCLCDRKDLRAMFPGATIMTEKVFGIPKSLIAFSTS